MKPTDILKFFAFVILLLALLSFFFPKDGIIISNNTTLHFPKISDFFNDNKKEYADISALFSQKNSDSISLKVDIDSILKNNKTNDVNEEIKKIQPIEYPQNDSNVLIHFFEYLADNKIQENVLHILHYGDSQIEGDRITGYIRRKLQNKFGGNGIGLIFPATVTPSPAFKAELSGNWQKKTMLGLKEVNMANNKYGIFFSYLKLFNSNSDTTSNSIKSNHGINITINPENTNYQGNQRVRLFYGNSASENSVKVSINKKNQKEVSLETTNNLSSLDIENNGIIRNVDYKFGSSPNPVDIYGISIESPVGIFADNIPLRGSSGYGFTQNNSELLKQFLNTLNVKLIIMQFGVNAVPENDNTIIPDYSYYEKAFYKQLITLKKIKNDLSIIVIGVSDRSRKNGEGYETNPNIYNIRKAQRNAAFKAGCAYWDLFEAMGGENSMPSWVFANPALANKDFTHFNDKGARLVAEMFYNSLILEYYKYIDKRRKIILSNNLIQ